MIDRIEIDVDALYHKQLHTLVDYGNGPRYPLHKKYLNTFLDFKAAHNGRGFVGHVPHDRMFFISDHHFGHKNIIKYADRPFDNVEEMNEHMIQCHNSVVGPDDYCIFGGDISFTPASKSNWYLSRMNGHKIFILGNHDFERDGSVKDYNVTESWLWWSPFRLDEEFEILVTHYPIEGLPKHVINIHGHIHERLSPNPQHINMCVEHHDYTPVRMDRMLEIARMRYEEAIG
jgi:calcineurin-like phosphoesterase family protein